MRRAILFAAAVVGAWAAQSAAQDGEHTIKIRRDMAGEKVHFTKSDSVVIKTAVTGLGMDMLKDEKKGSKLTYTQEVVERPADAKRATKLTRNYESAVRVVDGKDTPLAYEKKTVTIEKKGTKYTFTVDGEELSQQDAEELDKEFNKESESPLQSEDFIPTKPVKLNEVWEVDPAAMIKSFEAETPFRLNKDKTKVTGKLTKVYEKDGVRYGVMQINLMLATKGLAQGGMEIELKDGSKIDVKIDLDACIDGTRSEGTSSTAMAVDIKGDIGAGSLVISGNTTGKSVAKFVGKK